MLFINTRPQDRAVRLTQQLQAAQIQVVELPLLELIAQPYSAELNSLYQQLNRAQVIVVVSPTAVQIGMQYLEKTGIEVATLTHIQWIAVGKTTEQALLKYGIQSHVPEVESSEGMLQLPILDGLNSNAVVAFWRGEGGRLFIMDHLRQQGAEVLNFVLYQRQCPVQSQQVMAALLPQLQQDDHYVVLMSSEASWLNWLQLLQQDISLISKGIYLVLGPRLAAILGEYRQHHAAAFEFIQLDSLSSDVIVREMERVLGNS
ncbi:uroporphyrinogen-III synthase [Acinetobacter sp. LoGeW2-3]|uniref:uroporphyrinogen-III synthase n=1 Tax=Acinetobacter sp. LoGeW2-3 TaxID=1808001 RepID=UPI000C05C1C0|nr:uroporphyrinogen-III synthase [Acinetobacter sp. LoGeW2-3]ATO18912.1 uroporphyrinogen-III synthase [Acinetobacter sp. LoGeW2-3]